MEQDLNLGLIGNCSIAALVNQNASIEWFCWPWFDGDPIFSRLINGPISDKRPGYFDIHLLDYNLSEQRYMDRTTVLVTVQQNASGDKIEIIDFCPVLENETLPNSIVRLVRKVKGHPRIIADLRPTFNYGAVIPEPTISDSSSILYKGDETTLFLKTNADLEKIVTGDSFLFDENVFFVFGEAGNLDTLEKVEKSLASTIDYWRSWVAGLTIPEEYSDEVIRSAITLKLCTHKPLGGIVAAHTTSIPEFDNCQHRHWDYRYSWVRDNYFTVSALTALGDTECLRIYSKWLYKILEYCRQNNMYPAAFRISGTHDAEERIIDTLSGYRKQGMVRIGNEAYKQQQNDFFAGVILTVLPFFTDPRFKDEKCPIPVSWLEDLASIAYERCNRPDAGLWEFRTREQIFTYSAVNCWSACSSMEKIFTALENTEKASVWRAKANELKEIIYEQAWNAKVSSYTNAFGSEDADASLFLLRELGFIEQSDPRLLDTINFLECKLREGVFVYRHNHADDFCGENNRPVNSFTSCTLWMLMAMVDTERHDEARKIFDEFLKFRSPQGMFSEHIDPKTGSLWANYPQTYSMAGVIMVSLKINALKEKNLNFADMKHKVA
jgi:GH15 family glucan-1,4-alpha-glucosidase